MKKIIILILILVGVNESAKAIDLDQLTVQFLTASISERKNIIESLGLKLYIVDEDNLYVKKHFSKQTLGLFLADQENSKGLILVRDLTDTWTLIHEYQHALYHLTKNHFDEEVEFENLKNAKEDLVEVLGSMNTNENPSKEKLNLLAVSLKTYEEKLVLFLREFELEEVKIESHLQMLYETQKNLAEILGKEAYLASFIYKNKNCKRIESRLTELEILKSTSLKYLKSFLFLDESSIFESFNKNFVNFCKKP